jgi:negative regulator of sigma E activity
VWAGGVWAQDTRGYELLEKATAADTELTYQAECVAETHGPLMQPGAVGPTRIVYTETVDGPKGLRRIDYKEPPRFADVTVLEGPKFVYHLDRQRAVALRQDAAAGAMLANVHDARMSLLRENYTVSVMGIENVAGRDCLILEIMPTPDRAGNPWRRLFVDRHTNLPLRIENANGAGMLTNTRTVRRIAYDFRAAEAFFGLSDDVTVRGDPVGRGAAIEVGQELERQAGFGPLQPEHMPDGYVFAGALVIRANGARAVHIMYFDGLSTISLFEERVKNGRGYGGWGEGGTGAHELNWLKRGIGFTLIGDILPQELIRMRDSMP